LAPHAAHRTPPPCTNATRRPRRHRHRVGARPDAEGHRLMRLPRVRRIGHEEEASVVEHLDELRNRLFVALACLGVVFLIAFWRHQDIYELFFDAAPATVNGKPLLWTVFQVGEQFKIALSVSFWTAILVTSPVLFYQLYAYTIPAFRPEHQKVAWPLLLLVPSLFLCGVAFGYFIVIPAASNFLFNFDANMFNVLPQVQPWFEFCITMMLIMGLVFEMPALVLLLARLGIVTSLMLRHFRRYAIVVNAVIAAALPGADPVSMILELAPLLILYELSIWVAKLAEPRHIPSP
jgi:Tat protein translocase TatC